MNLPLIFQVAFSMLLARWKQTLVAAIGVTFSIAMFISLLSFMTGLNKMLDGLIINRTPHIRLFNEISVSETQPLEEAPDFEGYHHFISGVKPRDPRPDIRNVQAIRDYLQFDPRVTGATPKFSSQIFYRVGEVHLAGIIDGIEVTEELRLFRFRDYVTYGDPLDLKYTPNSIILGKGAADKMMVQVGDVIQISTADGQNAPLKVVGFFQSGLQDIDEIQSYASLRTVQNLLGKPDNYITDIQVKLHELADAPGAAKEYGRLFGVTALDIQTANAQFDTGTSIRSLISYAVGITLLIVAGFGIYNILNMLIYEKMDSIAILKATGFNGFDVRSTFLVIALSIGVFGALWGLFFGWGIAHLIDQVPFETDALPTIDTYPVVYDTRIYAIGAVFAVITTFLAGYFPAAKASKIDPVDIIRGK